MIPPTLPPALGPDTFLMLRFLLAVTLLLHLPFLGIVIAGSTASLTLNFFGRENRDRDSLRLSREWIDAVTLEWWFLPLLGLFPYPVVAYICRTILGGRDSLPPVVWLLPFAVLLAGCALLSWYRAAILRTEEPPRAAFLAGIAGLLSTIFASYLLFLQLGILTSPSRLPLIRSNLVFILSWNSLAGFFLFLGVSFGLAGGIALRLSCRRDAEGSDRTGEYDKRVRSAGTASALTGALAVPALVAFFLITFPVSGLSTEVFIMAATVPILALAAFALLCLLPAKPESGLGNRVSPLFALMFLALFLCYQAGAANAFQGLSGVPGPLAAQTVVKDQKAAPKPAAGAAAAVEKGKKVFDTACSVCHRFDVKVVGPALNDVVPKYKGDLAKLKAFIRDPVKVDPAFPAMPKSAIKEDEVDAVARYLMSQVKGGK